MDEILLKGPLAIAQHFNIVWTFMLLMARFTGMMLFIPGLGTGTKGLAIRGPGVIALAIVTASASKVAELPSDIIILVVKVFSELAFGAFLGMIPFLIVSGVQMAGQLASNTMGLAAANLIDPSLGINQAAVAILLGDLVTIVFLLVGGHHVVMYVAAGLGGQIVPGTIFPMDVGAEVLIDRSAYIFQAGVVLSAPVIVALLLTQFVMGLVTKAVPTVNIFIVSFPLTIGIGLVLIMLSLPNIFVSILHEMTGIENALMAVARHMI